MALQLNLSSAQTTVRIDAPEAYARIVKTNFDSDTGIVSVAVNVYVNASAAVRPELGRPPDASPIAGNVYEGVVGQGTLPSLDDTLPGIRRVLYDWLKTLPDFSGSIDV